MTRWVEHHNCPIAELGLQAGAHRTERDNHHLKKSFRVPESQEIAGKNGDSLRVDRRGWPWNTAAAAITLAASL